MFIKQDFYFLSRRSNMHQISLPSESTKLNKTEYMKQQFPRCWTSCSEWQWDRKQMWWTLQLTATAYYLEFSKPRCREGEPRHGSADCLRWGDGAESGESQAARVIGQRIWEESCPGRDHGDPQRGPQVFRKTLIRSWKLPQSGGETIQKD